jgi:transcriptional regulator with XRE-family HTH domain
MSSAAPLPVGQQLRRWREQRRLSQLDLSVDAAVSTRHLSFVETGRSTPSREMVLRLADRLDVPLRERNRLLTAAGYAPMYAERRLDDPALATARAAVDLVLTGHEPYPALAVDRHWNLIAHNRAVPPLLAGVAAELLQPPVNVLRLTLHPNGLAPRIVNLGVWRRHLLDRLRQQVAASGDARLAALADELRALPPRAGSDGADDADESLPVPGSFVIPLQIETAAGVLSFISTTTVFGTPVDITLAELALEALFPADAATAAALRAALEGCG